MTARAKTVVHIALLAATCSGLSYAAEDLHANEANSATGEIEGVVIYETDRKRRWRFRRYYVADRRKGHLAEAVVCLSGDAIRKPTASKPQRWPIDQKDYRFIPETLAVRVGDEVVFQNSDPALHDVTTRQRLKPPKEGMRQDSVVLRQGKEASHACNDAGNHERPITLTCRFHSGMRGWVYVFDHPFFQVTEKEGKFRFTDVPAGKHRLVMVHPAGKLRWEQEIEVKAGEKQLIEIRVSPDNLIAKDK